MKKDKELKRLVEEVVSIRKEISLVQEKINKGTKLLNETINQLQTICPHENTNEETKYHEGGYLHKSRYVTKHICTVCGVKVSENTTYGSYE
jgi:hypothetical protein